MTKKQLLLAVLIVAVVSLSIALANRVAAQAEASLDELALAPEDIPNSGNVIVLSDGYLTSNNTGHPLHPQSAEGFLKHDYLEAYGTVVITDQYQVGHHLYRYDSADFAGEQAEAMWQEIFEHQADLNTTAVDIAADSASSYQGRSLRVVDPETGGVYYWFIGTQERTLITLMVGGLDNEDTLDAFRQTRVAVDAKATND